MMYIFSTCEDFIRTVPLLQYDGSKPEDVDTDGEDHICLAGETEAMTSSGYIAISELVDTEGYIYSADGSLHAYEYVRKTRENAELLELVLDDGTTVKATPNHKFMLTSGMWARLDELREGDELWSL
jgi:intein/homing endonuclease